MPTEITDKAQFEEKVKKAKKDQLLIFYSDNSDRRRVHRYNLIAKEEADNRGKGKAIEVYAINLSMVTLDIEDIRRYQWNNEVICCVTINEGEVMEKMVNPFEPTLRQMVRNIL